MTITQLPYAICQNCNYQWEVTLEELRYYYVNCPNCNYRNVNYNAANFELSRQALSKMNA